jgi:[acyl-carrier-protein] S-malonyltransferase
MSATLAMFPGQGSQYVGMSQKLLEAFPYVKTVFEEAEDSCQLHIRRLCLEGPEDELKLTANTQPCLLATAVAYWKVLQEEVGLKPDLYAGHSLGEYSALVAAGKVGLGRASILVRKRGEAMQKAVPPGVGAMAAVMKMPVDQLEALCAKHSQPEHRVEIANYNSDAQLVIAGHAKAVLHLCEDLQKLQIRYVDLPVSAPFHSSLMKPAKLEMQGLLESSYFARNSEGIIANISGTVVREYNAQYLIDQIDGPVRWIQSIDTAKNEGIQRFVEVGPGKVLFGLVRRMVPRDGFEVIATDDIVEAVKALS